jgi:PAS domain S-box-containing protein
MQKNIDDANKVIHQLQREVSDGEDKLRSFFNSSSSIHLLIDTNETLIDFNRSAASYAKKFYNVALKQGVKVSEFIHEDHKEGFSRSYKQALEGVPGRTEKMLRYAGREVSRFYCYEPAWDDSENIIGVSYNAIDISDKVADEKKILCQYNSLRKMVAIQSQQIQEPVIQIRKLASAFALNGYSANKESLIALEEAAVKLEELLLKAEAQSGMLNIPRNDKGEVLWE